MKINKNNLTKICLFILFGILGFISGCLYYRTYSKDINWEPQTNNTPVKIYMEMSFQDTITPGIYGINIDANTLQTQLDTLQLWQRQ